MRLTYIVALSALLASCNSESILENERTLSSEETIRIESVWHDGFKPECDSRSSYTVNYDITFDERDKLGLILIGNDGTRIANVPFTLTEGEWSSTEVYNPKDISKIIAYYPYKENLDESITTVEALKKAVDIKADQSLYEDFVNSDLLVDEITDVTNSLNISFTHAFSLISISVQSSVAVGEETFYFNIAMDDVLLMKGEETLVPYCTNGIYLYIMKPGTELKQDDFRYTYAVSGGDKYTKTFNKTITTAVGTQYVLPCTPPSATGMSIGNFYCLSDNATVVILPANAASIPEGLTCKGVVFHVLEGDEWNTFILDNELTETSLPGYNRKHGLVVSLKDGKSLSTMTVEDLKDKVFTADILEFSKRLDACTGYKLTQKIKESGVEFNALDDFTEEIVNTTSWYVSSFYEMNLVYEHLDEINSQITNKTGSENQAIQSKLATISYQDEALTGFIVSDKGANVWAGIPSEVIRPIFAF